jgi:hypothetical protein
MTTAIEQGTASLDKAVDRGVQLVFTRGVPPIEASFEVIKSLEGVAASDLLRAVRILVASLIERELMARGRQQVSVTSSATSTAKSRVQSSAVSEIAKQMEPALAALKRYYQGSDGAMRPLEAFSDEDHRWRFEYCAAQEASWGRQKAFHRESLRMLSESNVSMISELPQEDRLFLGGFLVD